MNARLIAANEASRKNMLMDGGASHERMKNTKPSKTKKVVSKSARPAIHTTVSGRVACRANRAAAKPAANRGKPSVRARIKRRHELAACNPSSIARHKAGSNPAQVATQAI